MSCSRSFAPCSPLLLLLLLVSCATLGWGAPMAGELQCQCIETLSEVIHPKRIAQVELIHEEPHFRAPKVIATLKQGKRVCLDPTEPWVKLIVTRILTRYLGWGVLAPSVPCT
ncbi:interleukin-8-like [Carettochelys insculpta]|uniref:interleukin-8-like n=1 Tax=Carettochelys insculpta TaxID=44489 RepID=UPI003EC0909D